MATRCRRCELLDRGAERAQRKLSAAGSAWQPVAAGALVYFASSSGNSRTAGWSRSITATRGVPTCDPGAGGKRARAARCASARRSRRSGTCGCGSWLRCHKQLRMDALLTTLKPRCCGNYGTTRWTRASASKKQGRAFLQQDVDDHRLTSGSLHTEISISIAREESPCGCCAADDAAGPLHGDDGRGRPRHSRTHTFGVSTGMREQSVFVLMDDKLRAANLLQLLSFMRHRPDGGADPLRVRCSCHSATLISWQ